MALEFGTPPASGRKGRAPKYLEDAQVLRENPDKWAKLDTSHLAQSTRYSFAYLIRSGAVAGFAKGEFESKCIKGEVWVRYVGGDPR